MKERLNNLRLFGKNMQPHVQCKKGAGLLSQSLDILPLSRGIMNSHVYQCIIWDNIRVFVFSRSWGMQQENDLKH